MCFADSQLTASATDCVDQRNSRSKRRSRRNVLAADVGLTSNFSDSTMPVGGISAAAAATKSTVMGQQDGGSRTKNGRRRPVVGAKVPSTSDKTAGSRADGDAVVGMETDVSRSQHGELFKSRDVGRFVASEELILGAVFIFSFIYHLFFVFLILSLFDE
jgi:hypothetical protein